MRYCRSNLQPRTVHGVASPSSSTSRIRASSRTAHLRASRGGAASPGRSRSSGSRTQAVRPCSPMLPAVLLDSVEGRLRSPQLVLSRAPAPDGAVAGRPACTLTRRKISATLPTSQFLRVPRIMEAVAALVDLPSSRRQTAQQVSGLGVWGLGKRPCIEILQLAGAHDLGDRGAHLGSGG